MNKYHIDRHHSAKRNYQRMTPVYYSWDEFLWAQQQQERLQQQQKAESLRYDENEDTDPRRRADDIVVATTTNNNIDSKDTERINNNKQIIISMLDVRCNPAVNAIDSSDSVKEKDDIQKSRSQQKRDNPPTAVQDNGDSDNTNPTNETCNRNDDSCIYEYHFISIPYDELPNRRYELPPRHVAFGVVLDSDDDNDSNDDGRVRQDISRHQRRLHDVQCMLVGSCQQQNHCCCNLDDHLGTTKEEKHNNRKNIADGMNQNPKNSTSVSATTKPWNVSFFIVIPNNKQNNYKNCIKDHIQNVPTITNNVIHYYTPILRSPRLWQPDPMIQTVLLHHLINRIFCVQEQDDNAPRSCMEIWDLGSGVGRDVCFLAEELKHYNNNVYFDFSQQQLTKNNNESDSQTTQNMDNDPNNLHNDTIQQRRQQPNFKVVGYDQRYRNPSTDESTLFWHRRNVSDVTACRFWQLNTAAITINPGKDNSSNNSNETTIHCSDKTDKDECIDINTIPNFMRGIYNKNVICIYAVRFWNRPLFEAIALFASPSSASLFDGGMLTSSPQNLMVAISHFGKPTIDSTWNFRHPKERNVLERNELRNIFTSVCDNKEYEWSILHDQVVYENGDVWSETNHNDGAKQDEDNDGDCGQRTLIQFVAQWIKRKL